MTLAALAAQSAMISTIPVVVTGGIVMKFTEASMPNGSRTRRRRQPTRRRKASSRLNMQGDFSNVGF